MAIKGKNYLIIIYAILKKYATSTNPLSVHDIQKKLTEFMGDDYSIDRRTIRSHLETLTEEFEETTLIEECCKTEDDKYYFESPLDGTIIRLMADVIAASNYLSTKESKDLINEIYKLNMLDAPNYYENALKFKKQHKAANLEVFLSVETISEAIQAKKKISCVYMQYDIDQKLVPRNGGKERIIDVHEIIWTANYYYALCIFEDSGKVYFLRIDKMSNVKIVDEQVAPLPVGFDISQYVSTQPHLFGGQVQMISFLIKKYTLDQVIDSFGSAAKIRDYNGEYIKVELFSSIETMKVWLIQYCTVVRNIYPPQLQQMIVDSLERAILEIDEQYNLN